MDNAFLSRLLANLETEHILAYLRSDDLADLIRTPWIMGGLALFAVVALIMKWRALLALVLAVVGFGGLVSYTLRQDTSLSNLSNQSLLFFVGGGMATVMVVIYLLFIKTD